MSDPITEATEAAHRAYLSDIQEVVEDAAAVVEAGLDESQPWRRQVAFEWVLRAMLDDLGGPVAPIDEGDPHGVA